VTVSEKNPLISLSYQIIAYFFHFFDSYLAAGIMFSYSLFRLKGEWQLLKQNADASDFLASYLW